MPGAGDRPQVHADLIQPELRGLHGPIGPDFAWIEQVIGVGISTQPVGSVARVGLERDVPEGKLPWIADLNCHQEGCGSLNCQGACPIPCHRRGQTHLASFAAVSHQGDGPPCISRLIGCEPDVSKTLC